MNMDTIQQELKAALLTIYAEGEAATITDWVMEHHTGKSRMKRMIEKTLQLSDDQVQAIQSDKIQLLQHKPIQYVLGESWFMGLKFFVNESVLIPRPETEELVQLVIDKRTPSINNIIDIGTGSGCIPIALKKQLPEVLITAVDVSKQALDIAKQNASTHHTAIDFLLLDFLDESQWDALPIYNMIISNPPYIPLKEKEKLDKHVTEWEPGTALFAPDDEPLLFYKKIAAFGKIHLADDGIILMEIHQDFGMATKKLFEDKGYQAELRKDIYGNDRIIIAIRPKSEDRSRK